MHTLKSCTKNSFWTLWNKKSAQKLSKNEYEMCERIYEIIEFVWSVDKVVNSDVFKWVDYRHLWSTRVNHPGIMNLKTHHLLIHSGCGKHIEFAKWRIKSLAWMKIDIFSSISSDIIKLYQIGNKSNIKDWPARRQ